METVPNPERAKAVRLRRQTMGLLSYLMFVFPLVYSVHRGWVEFGYIGLAVFVLTALVINLAFYLAIRSGLTERFADPNLAFSQIAVASALALVMGYYTDEARVVTLMLFFAAFFFGVFSFSTRQYLQLTGMVAAGYALMLTLKYRGEPRDSEVFGLEVLHFLVLIIILLWMSLLGAYVAQLRSRLSQKKDALAQAMARLQELASHDVLTGAFNRRHLLEVLEQQRERTERYNEPFSICILDIDHFKHLNDTYGHQVGDEALQAFCQRMRTHARRMDVIGRGEVDSTFGRYGGEEFLLLLPYAHLVGAGHCMERLRSAAAAEPFPSSAGPLVMTFSAGVAEYQRGETVLQLLNRADVALYRAKNTGRNRVELAEAGSATQTVSAPMRTQG